MPEQSIHIKYWGIRGSIPTPLTKDEVLLKAQNLLEKVIEDGEFARLCGGDLKKEERCERIKKYLENQPLSSIGTYGGNTTCVEVRAKDSPLIIIDSGSGIRKLGDYLIKRLFSDQHFNPLSSNEDTKRDIHLFFSHYHWDHLHGFPFFKPAFIPGTRITFYGKDNCRKSISEVLAGQQETPNFPVVWEDMPCEKHYFQLGRMESLVKEEAGRPSFLPAKITYQELTHPDAVFAYRIEMNNKAFVMATDTEHKDTPDPRLTKLAKDADILYYDGQYTPEEYRDARMPKFDWGHSTFEWAIKNALTANVKKVVIGHHDPDRDDSGLENLFAQAIEFKDSQLKLPENDGKKLDVILAYEGLEQIL
ncbi:MBL fold metallo-hydrolase [Candidatus Riflebacteria bacterium]